MITELAENYKKETGAQCTDSLTGLLNYGFFEMSLDRELKRCERNDEPLTLALIDIDSFSYFNKRNTSVAGDRLLRELAGLVTDNIRQIDLAARYSGDVIVVVFTKSDTQTALVPLERIRQAVEDKYGRDPTISVGLTSYPNESKTKESLLENAYNALMNAKSSGKNKVRYYEKETVSQSREISRILVVDDDPRNVKLLEGILINENCEIIKAYSGEEALTIVKKVDIDLVLLDVMMPEMNGYEVCRRLKNNEATRLIPVVMVTALNDIEDKIKGIESGADDFLTKPPNRMELLARTRSLIKLKRLNRNLARFEKVLFSLANTVEAKDAYTQGHVERVSSLAIALGQKMSLAQIELEALRYGGALHDIGKIGVSRDIINKPGSLNQDEWEVIKSHPDIGYQICLPLKKNLGLALDVIRCHHEKLDGSGYPEGIKGDEIALVARIMAVVDIFDALTTDRPYREAMPLVNAIDILQNEANQGKLDKEVVRAFISMISSDKFRYNMALMVN